MMTPEERLVETSKHTPATFAVLLGTLVTNPDFEGIHKVWRGNRMDWNSDYSWVITLWPGQQWCYQTKPQTNLFCAVLEALQYLEHPVDPRQKLEAST